MFQVLGVHSIPFTEFWLLIISKKNLKKQKNLLAHFSQVLLDIYTVKKLTKTYIFTAKCEHFTAQLVEKLIKKLLMVFFMQRKLETKVSRLFSLENLVEHKNSFLNNLSPKKA